jgi:hypothetical protein
VSILGHYQYAKVAARAHLAYRDAADSFGMRGSIQEEDTVAGAARERSGWGKKGKTTRTLNLQLPEQG